MTEPLESGSPAQPKLDPETLVLRGRPGRAIRFRRGLIVTIAALASVAIIAVTWLALKPRSFHIAAAPEEMSAPAKAPNDALSALPTSYGDAPRLGPPLPGDLGRPILEHQRTMALDSAAATGERSTTAADTLAQQQEAELKAARQSTVLVQTSSREASQATSAVAPQTTGTPAASPRLALDPEHDPNGQQRKADFVGNRDTQGPVNPHALQPAASPYVLAAGSVIPASLITGLRSDLPGLVTAQVTERVFDSATGRILLIPQGARLIGSYDSVVAFGQKRALVVWQRIVFPDGSSLALDNVPATDPSGYAGLADKVDFHTWTLLKGVAISTLLGVGSSLTFTGESDLVQAIRESTQQNVSRAGDQLTSRNLQIQPTISIRPGTPVRLVVHRDLVLAPRGE